MRLIRVDVDRTRELVEQTRRVLTEDEASRVAGYVRALRSVARDRAAATGKKFAGKSTEELLAMAMKVPELRDAFVAAGAAGDSDSE